MSLETKIGYTIEDGPDRDRLIDMFKAAYDSSITFSEANFFTIVENVPVRGNIFTKRHLPVKSIRIKGLKLDGKSGWAFDVEGYMEVIFDCGTPLCDGASSWTPTNCAFRACYDTQTKRGRIIFLLPPNSI